MTGEEIKAKREAAYIPQTWLAQYAGITQIQLSKWEIGERPLPAPEPYVIGKLVEGIVYLSELKYPEAMALLRANGHRDET